MTLPAPELPVTTEVVVEAEAAVAVIVEASEADSAGSAAEAVADLEAEAPEEVGVDPEAEDPWEAVEVRGRSTGAEAEETEAWEEALTEDEARVTRVWGVSLTVLIDLDPSSPDLTSPLKLHSYQQCRLLTID